jgi:hypothetical protein
LSAIVIPAEVLVRRREEREKRRHQSEAFAGSILEQENDSNVCASVAGAREGDAQMTDISHVDLTTTEPSAARRGRGRPSLEAADAPLCARLVEMCETGQVRSIEAGAREVWKLAAGYGSSDSKVDRLAKRARDLRRSLPE